MASDRNKCGLRGGVPTVVVDRGYVSSLPMALAGLVGLLGVLDGRAIHGNEAECYL